jgi:septum site-determining protein MinD
VGKSTIAANLGVALGKFKLKTVVVDGNLEGPSLGLIMGVKPYGASLHDVLSGEIGIESAIVKGDGVDVVVGELKMEGLLDINFELFDKAVETLEKKYEVVLVDCPPGLGRDAVSVISACDEMVLVVNPDITSISEALKTIVVAKKLGTVIIGVLVNRAGSRYDIPRERIADIMDFPVIGEIKEDDEIKMALMKGQLLVSMKPNSKFSQGIRELAVKLVERIYPYKPMP